MRSSALESKCRTGPAPGSSERVLRRSTLRIVSSSSVAVVSDERTAPVRSLMTTSKRRPSTRFAPQQDAPPASGAKSVRGSSRSLRRTYYVTSEHSQQALPIWIQ